MRRTLARYAGDVTNSLSRGILPLLQITDATFYKRHPQEQASAQEITNGSPEHDRTSNPPLFPNLNFSLCDDSDEAWSIISPSSTARTNFLQILRGQHLCFPPTARRYPLLSSRGLPPAHAIHYVGFDAERDGLGARGLRSAYLSARYESRREQTDFSLLDFLLGHTELNPSEDAVGIPNDAFLHKVLNDLKLSGLERMSVNQLSNGQTRRARIAKALLGKPELLLLDGPFMGLDPPTRLQIALLLRRLAKKRSPRLILSLKPDEEIPIWISHVLLATNQNTIEAMGPKEAVLEHVLQKRRKTMTQQSLTSDEMTFMSMAHDLHAHEKKNIYARRTMARNHAEWTASERLDQPSKRKMYMLSADYSRDAFLRRDLEVTPKGEAVLEMEGVKVEYGEKTVLGDWNRKENNAWKEGLWWSVHRGQRWGVFGPNGSGKTTLLSLATSDHPQAYSQPIKLFGHARIPELGKPGISIFDIQSRIGHSSPEVHAFFPKTLSVRQAIESAWSDAPLIKPRVTNDIDERVNAVLRWFQAELNPAAGALPWMEREMSRRGQEMKVSYDKEVKVPAQTKLDRARMDIMADEEDSELLNWADNMRFAELSFSGQRVALFLRAIVKQPDLVILDEAFSGMDEWARNKCLLFLSHGESKIYRYHGNGAMNMRANGPRPGTSDLVRLGKVLIHGLSPQQALIVVSHKKDEVPGCVRDWLCLPEADGERTRPRTGRLDGPLELQYKAWEGIWNIPYIREEPTKGKTSPKAKSKSDPEDTPGLQSV